MKPTTALVPILPFVEPEAPECQTITRRVAADLAKGHFTSIAAVGFIRKTCPCVSCVWLRQRAKVAQ